VSRAWERRGIRLVSRARKRLKAVVNAAATSISGTPAGRVGRARAVHSPVHTWRARTCGLAGASESSRAHRQTLSECRVLREARQTGPDTTSRFRRTPTCSIPITNDPDGVRWSSARDPALRSAFIPLFWGCDRHEIDPNCWSMPHWLILLSLAIVGWFSLSVVVGLFFGRVLRVCSLAGQRSSWPPGRALGSRPPASERDSLRLAEPRRRVA
jgi:hypothetical protein